MLIDSSITSKPLPQLPAAAGVGLRAAHYKEIIDIKPPISWLEVHPENYFGGGMHRRYLKQIARDYPISFHCVGLSLGSAHPVCPDHLQKLKDLSEIIQPISISDHASWSASGNAHLNDLLPLPYTEETLRQLCDNIDRTQNFLGRSILVENPSTYLNFKNNTMSEAEFLAQVVKVTECGLLLDVNNIYVQIQNHGFDFQDYLKNIPFDSVKEIHLAGHTEKFAGSDKILIDTHNDLVRDDVWKLYEIIIQRTGSCATLIEWDQDIPSLQILLGEAEKAQNLMMSVTSRGLHRAAS